MLVGLKDEYFKNNMTSIEEVPYGVNAENR
jgi:hypothetical protein